MLPCKWLVKQLVTCMQENGVKCTHTLNTQNPHMVFNNKHYWPYTKYKNIYLNYK